MAPEIRSERFSFLALWVVVVVDFLSPLIRGKSHPWTNANLGGNF